MNNQDRPVSCVAFNETISKMIGPVDDFIKATDNEKEKQLFKLVGIKAIFGITINRRRNKRRRIINNVELQDPTDVNDLIP